MKNNIFAKSLIIFVLMSLICLLSFNPTCFAYASSNEPIITFSTEKKSNKIIEIVAKLDNNSGILAMDLALIYDNSAMTLVGFEYGDALATLMPISTNTNTEQGYGIYPFKFSYEGEANDYTEGVLMTMTFELKADCQKGQYKIFFEYEKDKSVVFLKDGAIKTKNLIVDKVSIVVNANKAVNVSVENETDNTNKKSIILIVCGVCFCVAVGVVVTIILLKRKRRKTDNWVKV